MTSLEKWSAFLGCASDPNHREVINEILSAQEAIGMAGTVLREISKDEHERARNMSRRKYETDMTNNYLVGVKRGKAEGKVEGMQEGAALLAKLLKDGMSLEDALKQISESAPD